MKPGLSLENRYIVMELKWTQWWQWDGRGTLTLLREPWTGPMISLLGPIAHSPWLTSPILCHIIRGNKGCLRSLRERV